MVWHDCKTDPPKENGKYILCFDTAFGKKWKEAWYENNRWTMRLIHKGVVGITSDCKWAEVDLSEVE